MAQFAVMSEPLLTPASMTIVASQSPEIILFLIGNVLADDGNPGGNSVISAPL